MCEIIPQRDVYVGQRCNGSGRIALLAAKEDQTREQAVRSDFEFHRKISEMAGNQLMSSLMTILEELLLSVMEKATEIPRAFRQNFELHFPIWEAVRDRDADAAERAMHEHMRLFFMRVEQNLSIPKSIDD